MRKTTSLFNTNLPPLADRVRPISLNGFIGQNHLAGKNKIIFNINEEVESRTIDTHVHNLRKKLKSSGSLINTIRSVGFIFKTD